MLLVGDCHLTENIDLVNGIKSVLGNRHPIIGGVTYSYVVEGNIVPTASNMAILVWGGFDLSFGLQSALEGDRSVPLLLEHAHEAMSQALAGNNAVPELVVTFDCNGRYGLLNNGNNLELEADTILSALGEGIPLAGNYTDGEMGTGADNVPIGTGYSVSVVAIYPREAPVVSNIELISPNGGQEWEAGTEQTISWQASDDIDNVKLEYTVDEGATWVVIAESVPASDGSYAWTVPEEALSNAKVRVSTLDGAVSDQSDEVFSTDIAAAPHNISLNMTFTGSHITIYEQGWHVIDVFSVHGELMWSFAGANKRSYAMNPVPESGVYLIKARTGKGIIMRRMVRM
jgi:hypothetical protein